jgi:hypothetical protein
MSWIRDLVRVKADTMPVIVIGQHDFNEATGPPQVFQFIHLPNVADAKVKLLV